ncbi:serine/arginine repetitive matrix protein 2-like [Penaeus monodon]|uniref:serine/arginine repetitive matrix protein 2-like n=1 Tax=Penaeus monodon TaxID=6687 RepID=UPI0018A70196|nr:serine/arginine repetitive matrix protein 2-like [Penaeus monodon]
MTSIQMNMTIPGCEQTYPERTDNPDRSADQYRFDGARPIRENRPNPEGADQSERNRPIPDSEQHQLRNHTRRNRTNSEPKSYNLDPIPKEQTNPEGSRTNVRRTRRPIPEKQTNPRARTDQLRQEQTKSTNRPIPEETDSIPEEQTNPTRAGTDQSPEAAAPIATGKKEQIPKEATDHPGVSRVDKSGRNRPNIPGEASRPIRRNRPIPGQATDNTRRQASIHIPGRKHQSGSSRPYPEEPEQLTTRSRPYPGGTDQLPESSRPNPRRNRTTPEEPAQSARNRPTRSEQDPSQKANRHNLGANRHNISENRTITGEKAPQYPEEQPNSEAADQSGGTEQSPEVVRPIRGNRPIPEEQTNYRTNPARAARKRTDQLGGCRPIPSGANRPIPEDRHNPEDSTDNPGGTRPTPVEQTNPEEQTIPREISTNSVKSEKTNPRAEQTNSEEPEPSPAEHDQSRSRTDPTPVGAATIPVWKRTDQPPRRRRSRPIPEGTDQSRDDMRNRQLREEQTNPGEQTTLEDCEPDQSPGEHDHPPEGTETTPRGKKDQFRLEARHNPTRRNKFSSQCTPIYNPSPRNKPSPEETNDLIPKATQTIPKTAFSLCSHRAIAVTDQAQSSSQAHGPSLASSFATGPSLEHSPSHDLRRESHRSTYPGVVSQRDNLMGSGRPIGEDGASVAPHIQATELDAIPEIMPRSLTGPPCQYSRLQPAELDTSGRQNYGSPVSRALEDTACSWVTSAIKVPGISNALVAIDVMAPACPDQSYLPELPVSRTPRDTDYALPSAMRPLVPSARPSPSLLHASSSRPQVIQGLRIAMATSVGKVKPSENLNIDTRRNSSTYPHQHFTCPLFLSTSNRGPVPIRAQNLVLELPILSLRSLTHKRFPITSHRVKRTFSETQ